MMAAPIWSGSLLGQGLQDRLDQPDPLDLKAGRVPLEHKDPPDHRELRGLKELRGHKDPPDHRVHLDHKELQD